MDDFLFTRPFWSARLSAKGLSWSLECACRNFGNNSIPVIWDWVLTSFLCCCRPVRISNVYLNLVYSVFGFSLKWSLFLGSPVSLLFSLLSIHFFVTSLYFLSFGNTDRTLIFSLEFSCFLFLLLLLFFVYLSFTLFYFSLPLFFFYRRSQCWKILLQLRYLFHYGFVNFSVLLHSPYFCCILLKMFFQLNVKEQ